MDVNFHFPGEKLVIRMYESFEKGVSGLLEPALIRRRTQALLEAKREEILVLAEAQRLARQIENGAARRALLGEVLDINSEAPQPDPRAIARENAEARLLRGEINVTKAILHAERALAADAQEPPAATVDPDWMARWRDAASAVSVDELQTIYGRILAGEVKAPGSCSLRTLNFVKDLSTTEARDIAKQAEPVQCRHGGIELLTGRPKGSELVF